MFGRRKQRIVYAVMSRDGYVHSAGNPDLREDWTLEDVARNFAHAPGMRCLVWASEVFSPGYVMGETAASLEQQYGAPDAVAEG